MSKMMYALWLLVLVAMAAALLDASQHHNEDPSIFIVVRFPRNPEARRDQVINPSHLVKELKLKIANGDMHRFNISYLLFGNQLMENDKNIDSYGIRNNSMVQFIDWAGLPKKQEPSVLAWNLQYQGRIDLTHLKPTDTVSALQQFVTDNYKVPVDLLYLLFNGQLLSDKGASLSEYGVEIGSCIGWAKQIKE